VGKEKIGGVEVKGLRLIGGEGVEVRRGGE